MGKGAGGGGKAGGGVGGRTATAGKVGGASVVGMATAAERKESMFETKSTNYQAGIGGKVLGGIPYKDGTYLIKTSGLKDVGYTGLKSSEVSTSGIKEGIARGVKFAPVKLAVRKDGTAEIVDGNHRLATAREIKAPWVAVRVSRANEG